MILLLIFAFLAGLVTVLSPCILPILPVILTSTIGGKNVGKARPLGVVFGFVMSFTFFTLFLSKIVELSGISGNTLRNISVVVIAGFGISLLIPKIQMFVEILFSRFAALVPSSQNKEGFWGGLLIGLSVGLLWTPCVGPILASVISLAITGKVTFDAFLITLAYSLGTSIPMFLIMWGGQNLLHKVPWLLKNLGKVQKIFGLIMIMTAVGIFFEVDRKFQTYILKTFPTYGTGLTRLEDNTWVKEQLELFGNSQKTADEEKLILSNSQKSKAPELIPGGEWFNSDPLTLSKLKGKVVIVDFWTYSCINCQRTLPYLKNWYEKYKEKGLVIIGVHSPEFEFEKNKNNVGRAIKDFGLSYPVVQDNNFATWRAYQNQYWPAKYFVDKDGNIRYWHFGEGGYDESEKVIQELLKESGVVDVPTGISNPSYQVMAKTPETYLGYGRMENFGSSERIKKDLVSQYTFPSRLGENQFAFEGSWESKEEYSSPKLGSKLEMDFNAKEVYLVMRPSDKTSKVKVWIDDQIQYPGEDSPAGVVTVDADRLYKLVKLDTPGRHNLKLEFEDDNCDVFAFTFG
ncbi:MAG: cytochrome c biogenesis protein DipZ [Candidatus Shapirobacteria bacterium]|jgi:cytochrome c biogenesis protein CcdA/thiol-disulfide isomerase/thioredoxin